MNEIQAFYYGAFKQAIASYEATDGELYVGHFIRRMGEPLDPFMTPPNVQSAYQYYYENVEKQDWGSVGVYQVAIANINTFAVHTTCDGDEQWLELYDEAGAEIGFAMIDVDEYSYTDMQTLRTHRISG